MRWSYPLFKVYGISIELHLTFLLFFFIFAVGNLTAFLFLFFVFTVVLAHELIHSLTAVLHGVNVPKITLLPIGGIASIELPQDPLLELKVSIVGPMFNFMLAGVGALTLYYIDPSLLNMSQIYLSISGGNFQMTSVAQMMSVLVYINFVLGAFNMLPAFPMDGGRVFRSILALWMDYLTATRVATAFGRFIFTILMVAGFFTFNLWWIIIGGFLSLAGGSEQKFVTMKTVLDGVPFKDVAINRFSYASENLTWGEFFRTVFRKDNLLYLIVSEDGVLKKVLDLSQVQDLNPKGTLSTCQGTAYEVKKSTELVADSFKEILSSKLILVEEKGKIIGYVTQDSIASATYYLGYAKSAA